MKKLLLPLLITSALSMTACCDCRPTRGNLAKINDSNASNHDKDNTRKYDGSDDSKKATDSAKATVAVVAVTIGRFNWDKIKASSANVANLGTFPYFKTPEAMKLVIADGKTPTEQPASKALDATTLNLYDGETVASEKGKLSYLNFVMAEDGKDFDKASFDNSVTEFMQSIGAIEFYQGEVPTNITEVIVGIEDDKATYNQEYMDGEASDFEGRKVRQFAINHDNGKLVYQVMSNDTHGEVGVMEVTGFKAPVIAAPVVVDVKSTPVEVKPVNKPKAPKVEKRDNELDKEAEKTKVEKAKEAKAKAEKVKKEAKKPTATEMTEQIGKSGKMILNIKFDSAKASIKKSDVSLVNEIYKMMRKDLTLKLSIEGYTDSSGEKVMNQKLSLARAREVKAELEKKGIDSFRLKAKGYGEAKPIAENDSAKGRAKNRRVELVKFK